MLLHAFTIAQCLLLHCLRMLMHVHTVVSTHMRCRMLGVPHRTLCTYDKWFARPAGVQMLPPSLLRPGALLMQPMTAHLMRMLLRFRMGCHSLPNVMGAGATECLVGNGCARSARCLWFVTSDT